MSNPFENIKFHPSMVGNLMTNLQQITAKQLQRLDELNARRLGIGRKLTELQEAELDQLINKRDTPPELPAGCITALNEIYREHVWRRKAIIDSKYMEKGNMVEQDCLDLVSRADGKFYAKNQETIENDLLIGTPDYFDKETVKDTKASWDMSSFDKADLTSLYEWQVKCYLWMTGLSSGEVIYCLVNSPGYMVTKDIERKWYLYGQPDQNNNMWIGVVKQIKRNMIFDFAKFREENPGLDLETHGDDDTVPERFRIKRFPVTLEDEDIDNLTNRLKQCRTYLIDKYEREMVSL